MQYLTEAPRMVETISALGYPLHFMKILAVAKLLGIAAIDGWAKASPGAPASRPRTA